VFFRDAQVSVVKECAFQVRVVTAWTAALDAAAVRNMCEETPSPIAVRVVFLIASATTLGNQENSHSSARDPKA
jgi:hypothetical protein